MICRVLLIFVSSFALAACPSTPATHVPEKDLGLLWVNHSAEYRAITIQTYQTAAQALPEFIENKSWSAHPGQTNAAHLPPAVVLDVDETVINNAAFQLGFQRPFSDAKLEQWNEDNISEPVPGVVEFIAAARNAGVDIFFVTNRPCEPIERNPDPCVQRQTKIRDIEELGISTDAEHVLLSEERGWDRAKIGRRDYVAQTHRIIMVFGDDLGDFVPCVRTKLYGRCTEPATKASRSTLVDEYSRFWGHGWYMLPGPMHGSWTSQL